MPVLPVELLEFVVPLAVFPDVPLPAFVEVEVPVNELPSLPLDVPLLTLPGAMFDEPIPCWPPTPVGKAVAPS